jgi:multicomponent Na+:H+ antiporter subunit E
MRTSALARWMASGTWLVVVWLLLWGSVAPVVVLSGVVVASGCLLASALPGLPVLARPRWHRLPALLLRFAVDLGKSSFEVLVETVRHGRGVRSAILAVPVPATLSDVAVTVISNRLSLVPGTLVMDMDRAGDTLFVYVLGVRGEDDVEAARSRVSSIIADVVAVLPPVSEEESR